MSGKNKTFYKTVTQMAVGRFKYTYSCSKALASEQINYAVLQNFI